MNRTELIKEVVANNPHGTRTAEVETIAREVFDVMEQALASGEKVSIADFGTFDVNERKARTGRNPQTGAPVEIPAKRVVKFKPAKALAETVNE